MKLASENIYNDTGQLAIIKSLPPNRPMILLHRPTTVLFLTGTSSPSQRQLPPAISLKHRACTVKTTIREQEKSKQPGHPSSSNVFDTMRPQGRKIRVLVMHHLGTWSTLNAWKDPQS